MRAEGESGFVLNVYKEISWTSHDAVSRVRRILGTRRVGHAGSLDPLASGVLLLGVGRGTKLAPYLMELSKEYQGTFRFGERTSTGDSGGEILERGEVPAVDRSTLQAVADSFLGTSHQIPPMVSAVKHEGQRLYHLARRGIEVDRKPRPIVIHRFEILGLDLPRVDFRVECGRGTYLRTLVEDFAAKFSALAAVEALTRTRVGPFAVADSCRLISAPCSERAGLEARSIPLHEALAHLPAIRVDRTWERRVRQGAVPPWHALSLDFTPGPDLRVRLLGAQDELLAVAHLELMPGPAERPLRESCLFRLERVL